MVGTIPKTRLWQGALLCATLFAHAERARACVCDPTYNCYPANPGKPYATPANIIDMVTLNNFAFCSCPSPDGMSTSNMVCMDPDPSLAAGAGAGGTSSATSTTTSTAAIPPGTQAAILEAAMKQTEQPTVDQIQKTSASDSGKQTESLLAANEVNTLGANQAATMGAVFCAQGANLNNQSPQDAAALYAQCQQNYDVANSLKKDALSPVQAVLDSAAAQATLDDFEKNFGVSRGDYLAKMLGAGGGGTSALGDLVAGKIASGKLEQALEAAKEISPADLTQAQEQYAVDLGAGGKKRASPALRDNLKKKMAAESAANTATTSRAPAGAVPENKLDGLTPLHDGLFASADSESEKSTLFDIVHLKYTEIRKTRGF